MFVPAQLFTLAAAQPFDGDCDGGWWWIGRIIAFVLWIAIIAFVIRWVVFGRRRWHGPSGPSPMDQARGVLAERYARGEIDADEYRQRSNQLRDER